MTENDENTDEYRYTGTGLSRPDEYIETGDTVVPSNAELRAFNDSFERAEPEPEPEPDDGGGESGDAGESEELAEPFPGYDEYTVSDVKSELGELSVDALEEMLAYERANKDRDTAKDALMREIDERRSGEGD